MNKPMSFEQAQELDNSTLWENVVNELDYRIACQEAKFRGCKPEDLKEVQNVINTLELLKRLPSDVKGREEASATDQP